MIKKYYYLTKPGIIYGNAVTAIAGFFLASKNHFNFPLFLATLFGLSFIIGSACVINNYIDRDIDEQMERTKNRALVKKEIPVGHAMIFALVLLVAGIFLLGKFANLLALAVSLTGFIVYVAVYSPLKRRTVWGTVIGSIAGAVPPVVGYTAVSGRLDVGSWLLFLILVFWQMPHFYSIAIYRLGDYAAAKIPVLPVKKGILFTKVNILLYILAFIAATILLTIYGHTGLVYLIVALLLGLSWLWMSILGFRTGDDKLWARKMFRFSLIVITLLSVMISINGIIRI